MLAQSSEFENMAVRDEELPELDNLAREACPFDIKGGSENKHGKINILLQVSFLLPWASTTLAVWCLPYFKHSQTGGLMGLRSLRALRMPFHLTVPKAKAPLLYSSDSVQAQIPRS